MDPSSALQEIQQHPTLSILHLSEPLLNPPQSQNNTSQLSNRSSQSFAQTTQTPSTLAADLAHYRDLFSKLRFSYVEQVTKERFLRAVVAEQPEFVSAQENVELEESLKADKAALKAKKEEVQDMVGELHELGSKLGKSEDPPAISRVRAA
jgi:hypothetical protein